MQALWQHQKDAIEFVNDHLVNKTGRGGLLAHDMGTGKTRSAIELMTTKTARAYGRFLVVAPYMVAIDVWEKQIEEHWLARAKPEVVPLYAGSQAKRTETLNLKFEMNPRRDVVFIVNYDILTGGKFTQALQKHDFDWIILDESHKIKSHTGKISKNVRKLTHGGDSGRSPKVLLLTGTPMPHSFLDIWAQAYAINPFVFGDNFFLFKNRFARMGGYKMKEVKGIKWEREQEFYKKCSLLMHRVATEDAIDLPEITFANREIELPDEIRRLHDEMMLFLATEIKGEDGEVEEELVAQNALVKLLRMQQITSGLMTPDIENAKMKMLAEIVEDSGEKHVVVFYRFVEEGKLIEKHLTKDKVNVYHVRGRQNVEERKHDIDTWRENGGVLAVQIQAGGQGIDLKEARLGVYVSMGYSLGDYLQSVARLHRAGQKRNVLIMHLVGRNTVDEMVTEAVGKRNDVIGTIISRIKGAT